MPDVNKSPTQFQDINSLLIAIDWFGRSLTVHTIGKFLYKYLKKLQSNKNSPTISFWGGEIKGLVPMITKDNNWEIISNDFLEHCLTCFSRPDFFFLFYDEPSEEVINVCKSCTKEILEAIKNGKEIFKEDQKAAWFKVRMGIKLTSADKKIMQKYTC